MPGHRGRPAADRGKVRAELARKALTAAEEAIATARFADLSIEQLTRQAGISRSKFYVYFQDKDDLIRAWFDDVWDEVYASHRDWWQLGHTASKDDLRTALANVVESYRPHATLMAAVYDQALHNSAIRSEVEATIERNIAGLAKHIRRGQHEGFIKTDLLPRETAAWLTWMAERTQHALEPDMDQQTLRRHVDTYTDIVWNSLYSASGHHSSS